MKWRNSEEGDMSHPRYVQMIAPGLRCTIRRQAQRDDE